MTHYRTCFNPRAHAGRDFFPESRQGLQREFQSTRPRRARLARLADPDVDLGVSIHAPTQGATWVDGPKRAQVKSFNPRAHAGRDNGPIRRCPLYNMFQSTRPRRARQHPRIAEGKGKKVSIHAPTQGATRPIRSGLLCNPVSIHAPTQGATC